MSGSVTIKVLPNELTASSAIPGISAADKGDLSNWLYPKTKSKPSKLAPNNRPKVVSLLL